MLRKADEAPMRFELIEEFQQGPVRWAAWAGHYGAAWDGLGVACSHGPALRRLLARLWGPPTWPRMRAHTPPGCMHTLTSG